MITYFLFKCFLTAIRNTTNIESADVGKYCKRCPDALPFLPRACFFIGRREGAGTFLKSVLADVALFSIRTGPRSNRALEHPNGIEYSTETTHRRPACCSTESVRETSVRTPMSA